MLSYPRISGSATVLCTKRLLDCMARHMEFEVHCLCTLLEDEDIEEKIGNVRVHRVKKTIWKRCLDACSKYPKIQKGLVNIQKILTSPIFPCRDPFMLRRFKQQAKKLIEKNHYDIIIAEHHGYTTLMTGYAMKKKYSQIKFYPLLWDPILGQSRPTYLPKGYVDKCVLRTENEINTTADNIFSIQAAKGIYACNEDSSNGRRIYIDIPGIIPTDPEVPTPYLSLIREGYINIVYSGILSNRSRNPEYIINTLNKTSCSSKLNLIFFYKGLPDSETDRFKEEFKGNITFHDYIPIEDLHTLYIHSDFLLNISHVNANMTPSKIFEYMSYGKPIISTYITDGDAAKSYLDLYPEALIIDQKQNITQNVDKLEKFILSSHGHVDFETVKTLYLLNTPEAFVSVVSGL